MTEGVAPDAAGDPQEESVDTLIIGAGPVGLTLHLALAAGGHASRLIDRRPPAALQADPRALALSHGARQLLEQIGSWPGRAATAIETIHVSQQGGFGRTLIDRADYALPALGYVVRYRDLAAALAANLKPDALLAEAEITRLQTRSDSASVTVRHAGGLRTLHCRHLVHAEGTPTGDPAVAVSDYHQQAVICEVTAAGTPPVHRAWERFTPDGPLALLPLGKGYSVVLTLPPDQAAAALAMDDDTFLAALSARLANRLRFTAPGPRHGFPLALRLRAPQVKGCEVWIGNAAQTLHPVSGQGFNLGLRDAWQLAEFLLKNRVDRESLTRYAARRQFDRWSSAGFTDALVRGFSNDCPPLRFARGLGLLALDVFPPARHFVARRMIWGARAWL